MHGVVVIPLSSPDKAVFFKDFYYLSGYFITVGEWYIFVFTTTIPLPIVRQIEVDVDGYAVAMHTEAVGAADKSPHKRPRRIIDVFEQFGMAF